MIDKFISWACYRSELLYTEMDICNSKNVNIFKRYCFLRMDEYWHGNKLRHKLPWWLPFNMFIHKWKDKVEDDCMHSHPRWSISIVLKGELREITPRYDRIISPGSIIIRLPRARHKFFIPKQDNEVVTLFIVGRRKYTQYDYDEAGNILNIVK